MKVISITAVLVVSALLCNYELLRMIKDKSYKEAWVFSLLLSIGISLAILRSLKVVVSNPSDWLAWLFSPFSELLRNMLD